MKTMHLFAGIGGGMLADLILGHEPIIAVEWDKYACKVLRERAADGWFPALSVWEGDVRMFDPSEYAGRVDCIAAGFPCQPFSVAGSQKGSTDERGDLFADVIRCVEIVRPKFIFLENVPGLLSSKSPVCVCGWPYRRGGVYWNSIEEREVSCSGSDNRDVHKSKKPDGSASDGIRGDCMQNEGQERQMAGSAEMAYWRGRRGGISQEDRALFDAETTTSGIGDTVRDIAQEREMGCGEDCTCGRDEKTDAPAKPEGARCPQCGRGLVSADAGHIWYVESIHGSLASHGYRTKWLCIRASDVGAPHGRDRWFALAEWKGLLPHTDTCGTGRREQQQEGIEGAADVCNTEHDGQLATKITGSSEQGNDNHQTWTQQASKPARPSEQHAELAYTQRDRLQGQRQDWNTEGQTGLCGGARRNEEQDVCYPSSAGLPNWAGKPLERSGAQQEFERPGGRTAFGNMGFLADGISSEPCKIGWWDVEPDIGRLESGVKDRVSMLKGLGNAQVPIQAAAAFTLLLRGPQQHLDF